MNSDVSAAIGTDSLIRFRRLWKVIGALLIGFVIYASLTPDPIAVPVEQGDKYGHMIAYATLMLWFAQLHADNRARIRWAVAFIMLGVGLEFLQRLIGYRTFEVSDMIAGALGVLAGWTAAPPRSPNVLRYIEARWPAG